MNMEENEKEAVFKLLGEIRTDIRLIKHDIGNLEKALDSLQSAYERELLPNVNTWNTAASNQNRVVWTILTAVAVAVLGLIISV